MAETPMLHRLPVAAYTSRDWYDREQETIFSRTWRYAGFAEDIAEPGQYMAVQAGLNNIFIVMGRDRRLRAFHNICRHRGTQPHPRRRQNAKGADLPLSRLDLRSGRQPDLHPGRGPRIRIRRQVLPRSEAGIRRFVARHAVRPSGPCGRFDRRMVRRCRTDARAAPGRGAGRISRCPQFLRNPGQLEDRRREFHRCIPPLAPAFGHPRHVRSRQGRIRLCRAALRVLGAAFRRLRRGYREERALSAGHPGRTGRNLGPHAVSGHRARRKRVQTGPPSSSHRWRPI